MQELGNRLWRLTEKAACRVLGIFFRFVFNRVLQTERFSSSFCTKTFLLFQKYDQRTLSRNAISWAIR